MMITTHSTTNARMPPSTPAANVSPVDETLYYYIAKLNDHNKSTAQYNEE